MAFRMAFRRTIGLLAMVWLLATAPFIVGFGPQSITESQEAREPFFSWQVPLVRSLEPPQLFAQAAVAIDGVTGQILYDRNSHTTMAPASLTKIMTAILALENGRLEDIVDVKVDSSMMMESSVMGLAPGVRMTLKSLLYGLLVESGNDAAVAIAEHIAGDVPTFVAMMNRKAEELGLRDTHFANPHGLDAEGHYSSPYDLAIMTRYAMRNPVFAEIVATKEMTIREGGIYPLRNSNRLLGSYPGATGVKTGWTDNAGRALVASAKRDGVEIYAVVMNTTYDAWFTDAAGVLDYSFQNFQWKRLSLPQNNLALLRSDGGETPARLVTNGQPVVVLPRWQVPYLRYTLWLDNDSQRSGLSEPLGWANFYLGKKLLVELPVYRGQP